MTEQELFKLKEKVDIAKTTVSELRGQYNAMMKQLKDDWKIISLEDAKMELKKMSKEIDNLNQKISKHTEELETKFEL
jgi:hypothetical protein